MCGEGEVGESSNATFRFCEEEARAWLGAHWRMLGGCEIRADETIKHRRTSAGGHVGGRVEQRRLSGNAGGCRAFAVCRCPEGHGVTRRAECELNVSGRQTDAAEPEGHQSVEHSFGILRRWLNEQIQVARHPRCAMVGECVGVDDQCVNVARVEALEQFAEVAGCRKIASAALAATRTAVRAARYDPSPKYDPNAGGSLGEPECA